VWPVSSGRDFLGVKGAVFLNRRWAMFFCILWALFGGVLGKCGCKTWCFCGEVVVKCVVNGAGKRTLFAGRKTGQGFGSFCDIFL
jgi:hypothetical protein